MCTVCGCSDPNTPTGPAGHTHDHHHDHDHDHDHHHAHDHDHDHDHGRHNHGQGTIHFGAGEAGVSVAGMGQGRLIRIERDILAKNNTYAAENRRFFEATGTLALNLLSSPGSGKTTLLVRTIQEMKTEGVYVIEGDQQTSADADRIRATGAPAVQINTGKGCHLDAHMVGHAVQNLEPADKGLIFIENVGNLVCPAAFDLGEAYKVVILSVTEGEDKPLKYPDMFAAADLMLINKVDLLPHLDFDVEKAITNARRVNPSIRSIRLSARTGEGMADWLNWIAGARLMASASCQPQPITKG